jgi:glutamine synthetase
MATNHIIPAALAYQTKLLKNVKLMKDVCPDTYESQANVALDLVRNISSLVSDITTKVDEMVEARKAANVLENEYEKATAYHAIAERLEAIRRPIDKLEEIVDNDLWPLPKYRELLFIN